ncbi:MAG: helix-turn-helix transcriptional regulator [Candidatus Berkiella sp.]
MKNSLINQLKRRRLELGLKQSDMILRVGISRQQYQHLESKGNPRLETLELIAKGLNSEIMLIPKEKLSMVQSVLETDPSQPEIQTKDRIQNDLSDNPWQGLLEDEE